MILSPRGAARFLLLAVLIGLISRAFAEDGGPSAGRAQRTRALVDSIIKGRFPGKADLELAADAVPLACAAMGDASLDNLQLTRLVTLVELGNGESAWATEPTSSPGLDVKSARDLQALLKRELDKPRDEARPVCARAEPVMFTLDECTPRAGFVVAALKSFGPRASFASDEVERAASMPGLARIAHRAAVKMRTRPALVRIITGLHAESEDAQLAALSDAVGWQDVDADLTRELQLKVRSPRQRVRTNAAFVLATQRDAAGLQVLIEALRSPHLDVVRLGLGGLGQLGSGAAPAKDALWDVLLHHPVREIRIAAGDALGKTAPDPPCGRREGKFADVAKSATIRWCGTVGDAGGVCFEGENRGEWGGTVSMVSGSNRRTAKNDFINPLAFANLASGLYVVSGLRHLESWGSVWRVIVAGDVLRLERLVDLPGAPRAWRAAEGDSLLIATDPSEGLRSCREQVVRVTPAGVMSIVE